MRKLKDKKGFTLLEMLVCSLTLTLVGLICTVGFNMAMKSYNDSLFESNSQTLEAMLNTAIGDVLRYTDEISLEEDDANPENPWRVIFSNETYGIYKKVIPGVGTGMLVGELKINDEGYLVLVKDNTTEDEVLLISTKNYVDGLYIDEFKLTHKGEGVLEGSYTIVSDRTGRERTVDFTYKSIKYSIK